MLPQFRGKKFLATVKGTRHSNPPYREGEYENRQCRVESVFDPQTDTNNAFSQTAEVVFDNPPEKLTFLVQYLVPVRPERNKDRVVALGGEHMGDDLIVQQIEDEQCAVTRNGGIVLDINTEMLAKVYHAEEGSFP